MGLSAIHNVLSQLEKNKQKPTAVENSIELKQLVYTL